MTEEEKCCPDCLVPEHDTTGEDYRGAVPESCGDEGCPCHHPLSVKASEESKAGDIFGRLPKQQ